MIQYNPNGMVHKVSVFQGDNESEAEKFKQQKTCENERQQLHLTVMMMM